MVNWCLLAGGPFTHFSQPFDAYAGIDAGAVALLNLQLPLDLAVGDFDSVSDDDWHQIKAKAKKLVTSSPEKDDTDLELGLKAIFEQEPDACVTVYGALGGRLDHSLSGIFLPSHPDLAPFMQQIKVVDNQNTVAFYPQGRQLVPSLSGYDYVGFMLEGQGQLVIKGAKYEMDEKTFFSRKMYGSNAFCGQMIEVTVPDGYLVVVYSKD